MTFDPTVTDQPTPVRATSAASAGGALFCAVMVPMGFAVFVLATVMEGNLTLVGVVALGVAALGWSMSRRCVDAATPGGHGRRGPLATASPRYLRVHAHALGWPARLPAAIVWALWAVPGASVVFFVGSFLVRVLTAAAS